MKTQNRFRQSASALMALSALLILTPSASAIPLTWLGGPEAGQAFAGGGIVVKAFNYDTGTLYNGIPVGTSIGYTGNPGGTAAGEATLNLPANVFRPALNANPAIPAATEDSWGVFKITQIQAYASNGTLQSIYNLDSSTFELTGMFWGIRDFHLTQVSPGSGSAFAGQVIDGTGMRLDIYSDPLKDFNQTAGPGGRTGVSTYNTATNGTLELSLLSTPGFINANGTFGGSATEFQSNTADVGTAALNVIGGASAAQFNTNGIGFGGSSGAGLVPGVVPGQSTADIWLSFTSIPGTNGWDVNSNDPMVANIATGVPDSGSALLMFAMGLAGLGFGCRRFSRKV
jgi:hypothetical protein